MAQRSQIWKPQFRFLNVIYRLYLWFHGCRYRNGCMISFGMLSNVLPLSVYIQATQFPQVGQYNDSELPWSLWIPKLASSCVLAILPLTFILVSMARTSMVSESSVESFIERIRFREESPIDWAFESVRLTQLRLNLEQLYAWNEGGAPWIYGLFTTGVLVIATLMHVAAGNTMGFGWFFAVSALFFTFAFRAVKNDLLMCA